MNDRKLHPALDKHLSIKSIEHQMESTAKQIVYFEQYEKTWDTRIRLGELREHLKYLQTQLYLVQNDFTKKDISKYRAL